MSLVIRKAMPSDAAAMADIHMRSWSAAYAAIIDEEAIALANAKRPELWRRILSGSHDAYIALSDGVPAGLMSVHASRDADRPAAGEIGGLYLAPEYFGRGIGAQMMQFGLAELRRSEFREVILWVLAGNARARKFYEKCGFRPDGAEKQVTIGKPLTEIRFSQSLLPEADPENP